MNKDAWKDVNVVVSDEPKSDADFIFIPFSVKDQPELPSIVDRINAYDFWNWFYSDVKHEKQFLSLSLMNDCDYALTEMKKRFLETRRNNEG
jgi:hypothetical protein